ncbi:MAG: NAD(P)/FAD-dependent oxidoreductase [Rhizobacter sp.]
MNRPRILVIGCGFGGLETVRALSPNDVEITLVDRTNHHLFQPLLYQVATAGLSAPAVSAPIRHTLRREMQRGNLTVLQAEVTHIDTAARTATLDAGDALEFDHLIVAAGATHSYFGHDDWAAHAPGLKTLADAFGIRARVIGAFEHAERCTEPALREPWMTFAVIGAGPTGVEMAGTMIEIAHHTLPQEFRRIDSRSAHVVLLEGSDRVLGAFVPSLSEIAREQLVRLGVDVRTGCQVTGIDADGVTYQIHGAPGDPPQTRQLHCKTVIWAAGVAASPLGRVLATSTGATLDRVGRVTVQPDLSIAGCPHVWVIGDLASARSHPKGLSNEQAMASTIQTTPVPGVSPAAKQMGRLVAANLMRRLRGEETQAFHYSDYGNLATVGRHAAVVDLTVPRLGALRFSGTLAWLFWLFAHVYFLIGFRNRLMVMLDWGVAYWTYERGARVVAEAFTIAKPEAVPTTTPSNALASAPAASATPPQT